MGPVGAAEYEYVEKEIRLTKKSATSEKRKLRKEGGEGGREGGKYKNAYKHSAVGADSVPRLTTW